MTNEPSRPLVNTLIAERAEAHRRYNEALTALDVAIQALPDLPPAPAPYDETMLPAVNDARAILPEGRPARPSGWKGPVSDLVWQLIGPAMERQAAFNSSLVDHLNRNVAAHRDAHAVIADTLPAVRRGFEGLVRFESLLVQFLQQITPLADASGREVHEAIAQLRNVADVAQRAAIVAKREVERLGVSATNGASVQTVTPAPVAPVRQPARNEASKYLGFEDRFRGSEDEIRGRLVDYVPLFEGASNVIDIGCGRGEFLDLLRERGVTAQGVDLNPEMVEACVARGLAVSGGDALGVLDALPDEALGGLIAIQVIEHLEPAYLSQFLQVAYFKLRPGARIVLETINPACWVAYFESYIRDLTHVRPIHPETLQYMLQASGFGSVELIYRAPIAEEARLERVTARPERFGESVADPVTELTSAFNRNVDRLNGRLFTFQDFAAVGVRT